MEKSPVVLLMRLVSHVPGNSKIGHALRFRLLRGSRANIRQRNRASKNRDELHLRAQFQVKVEKHDQSDADPDVENEINAAADTGPQGDVRGVIGHPGEIKAGNRNDYRKY